MHAIRRRKRSAGMLLGALVLAGMWLSYRATRDPQLSEIIADGELVVLTRNAPTIYYEGREGPEGPEYDLVRSFAAHLGVTARFVVLDSVSDILDAVRTGRGHLAAAGLTRTPHRDAELHFGPDYRQVREEVVCRRGGPQPETVDDLVGLKLAVIADSSYHETLRTLQRQRPELRWRTIPEVSTEELLEQVWRRELDCTVADSNIVAINRRYYPELLVAFALSGDRPLAWAVADRAQALVPALEAWWRRIQTDGELAAIEERSYGHLERFDYVDIRVFLRRITERLPSFRPLFEKAADKHALPWTLLAAMAYQESHWNPRARSPTGVRGLMMLTRRTAKEVKVKNRLDPAQSVRGGALYLANLAKRLPDTILKGERLWFALAAYNVGMGHLYDARRLARRLDRDPDRWADMKEVLPLLSRKQYYKTLKYGYARGSEPVRYVQRIRDFHDLLERHLAGELVVTEPALTQVEEVDRGGAGIAP